MSVSTFIQTNEINKHKNIVFNATIVGTIHSDSVFYSPEFNSDIYECDIVIKDAYYYTINDSKTIDGKIYGRISIPVNDKPNVGDKIEIHTQLTPLRVVYTDSFSVSSYVDGYRYEMVDSRYIGYNEAKPNLIESIKLNSKTALSTYVPCGDIMYSMMCGDTNVLDETFLKDSRSIGIAHLFAVSGLHLGIVAGLFSMICKKLKCGNKLNYFITLTFSFLYAVLVGFGPSVARAFLMLTIYKTGKLFGYRNCQISSLSLSAIIILTISPIVLFNLSFQLSVMAIVGLIFFTAPLEKVIRTPWKSFNSFVAMNLSVNIALLPFMVYYFARVSLIFLLANLLIVPIITLIFPFVFVFVLFSALIPQIAYVLVPFGYIFSFIEMLTSLIANIPFLSFSITLNIFDILLYVVFLVVISSFLMINRKIKVILTSSLCVMICTVSVLGAVGRVDGSCKLQTVASSSAYDIVLANIKDEHYLIVNGAFNETIGNTVANFLTKRGVSKLDGIVKSKFSASDLDALGMFKNYFNIKSVITNESNKFLENLFGSEIYFSKSVGEYLIMPVSDQLIMLKNDDNTRVLFADYRNKPSVPYEQYVDVVYCVGDFSCVNKILPKYFVSNIGVTQDIPYSINSYFTFIIKNAKIKVI